MKLKISTAFTFLALIALAYYLNKDEVAKADSSDLAALVYPQLDTENSRWFFFSSASRPFGMVNLSPDNEVNGAWGSGYRYKVDTVKGFSHIHAWQLSGLSVFPVTLSEDKISEIFTDFYSKFSHETEKIAPGYHYLELERYGINVALTSTKRVGFHRYNFPENDQAAILMNLNGMLGPNDNLEGKLNKLDSRTLSGELLIQKTIRRPKPVKLFFYIQLDQDIQEVQQDETTGNYLVKVDSKGSQTLMKAAISYTSIENAKANLEGELNHWDFDRVVADSRSEWNEMLGRIKIEGGSEQAQRRFYTDLWHALQGRRVISDLKGTYPDYTGDEFRIGQLPLDETGKPKFNQYNSDSFWGAQWTLNTLWGMAYPDIMEEFVHSLIQYYKDGGLVPRGPSGGNYTNVMTGASSTPFIVTAIQKGIVTEDLEYIYQALKKNHMPGGIMEKSGYEHNTNKGGGLSDYIEKGYVPYPNPAGRFGGHQDGASLTLEYSYQDWTLAQLAKKLGHEADYAYFMARSKNYKNVYDPSTGWIRPKNLAGEWKENFDPYQHQNGFVEANGAQATWFVPHDLKGLATLMGGEDKAAEKLNEQFSTAEKQNFAAGNSHAQETHPEYRRVPINYGNQPSIQTAFVFNYLDRPDLTQYWSRKVVDAIFSGLSPATGYFGDEDQGLMGSLAVLMKLGLFQMNGGTEQNPTYDIGSPIFDQVSITLDPDYYSQGSFVIRTINNSSSNVFVKKASLNGRQISGFKISQEEFAKGGELVIEMSDTAVK